MSASIFQHAVTGNLLAGALGGLWRVSARQRSRFDSGRMVFPATRVAQVVMIAAGILFAILAIASSFLARKPGEWWVPYLFLGFVVLAAFGYPPLLTIEMDGVESRTWYGHVKKIRWEDVASLHYNTGNKQFTIRG